VRARRALEALCRSYRKPVLAYIRNHGYDDASAEDLTQAFFARIVESAGLPAADPKKGRFRTYLLVTLQRFLIDANKHTNAIKRGGHTHLRSLDSLNGMECIDQRTPERAFEQAWAAAVLRRALRKLRTEVKAAGKVEMFDHLSEFLAERPDEADYSRVAHILNLRRNTVAVAVHRLRVRLRELVREQLADTAANAAEVERPEQIWIQQLATRMPFGRLLVAVANKHARQLWAMLARGEAYDPHAWIKHPMVQRNAKTMVAA